MKGLVISSILSLWLVFFLSLCPVVRAAEKAEVGEELFKKHCAMCHPDGGNIINPKKTLGRKALEAAGIKTTKDVIGKMRNPDPGMARFDEKSLPEEQARAIAEYVLKTFR